MSGRYGTAKVRELFSRTVAQRVEKKFRATLEPWTPLEKAIARARSADWAGGALATGLHVGSGRVLTAAHAVISDRSRKVRPTYAVFTDDDEARFYRLGGTRWFTGDGCYGCRTSDVVLVQLASDSAGTSVPAAPRLSSAYANKKRARVSNVAMVSWGHPFGAEMVEARETAQLELRGAHGRTSFDTFKGMSGALVFRESDGLVLGMISNEYAVGSALFDVSLDEAGPRSRARFKKNSIGSGSDRWRELWLKGNELERISRWTKSSIRPLQRGAEGGTLA